MLEAMRYVSFLFAFAAFAPSALAQTGAAYIPQTVPLPGASPLEVAANQVWSLRAALNVAALQCQFSPFLRTVPRYNAMIKQHAKEFARAQTVLGAYFRRTGGKTAASALDRYNTRLYQSYTTLDAQLAFCNAASAAGRDVLTQPIGRLGAIAPTEVLTVRAALTPVIVPPIAVEAIPAPEFDASAE